MTRHEIRKIAWAGMLAERARLWCRTGVAANDATCRGILRYQPRLWLGRDLRGCEPRQFSREMGRMQRDGLVKLIHGQRRLTHVQLRSVLTLEGKPT